MAVCINPRPESLRDVVFTYCGGCGHGIANRLIGEVIDELGIKDRTILAPPIGCAAHIPANFDVDAVRGAHGRAPAVATGIKRMCPDKFVFTYQGDGDLGAIGTAEIFHAAARGEKISTIFINNAIYGMTGGQMAPTTNLGQVSTTTPFGRTAERAGYPVHITEALALQQGCVYAERCSFSSVPNIRKAKAAIKKSFQCQLDGLGFSIVEILSPCPTNWNMSPAKSMQWIDAVLSKEYPLGVIKEVGKA